MFSLSAHPVYAIYLFVWLGLWSLGGVWIVRGAFRLAAREQIITGILIGLVVENILANFLGRVLPLGAAFWLAAGIVFGIGLMLNWRQGWKELFSLPLHPWQIAVWLGLFGLSFAIQRGYAIYDDFANLPSISLLAAGSIPPLYALAPNVVYAYHYFLMLLAAQVIQISGLYVWTAFDLVRALAFSLTIMAAGIWGMRMTGSKSAGALTGVMTALGSGTRWLLLVLPPALLERLSLHITLIGSGANTAPTLVEAMMNNWAIEGGGPRPFPFAFANGLIGNRALHMFSSNSMMGTALILLFLLTFNRWRDRTAAALVTLFLWGASGLLGETELVLTFAAWGLLAVFYAVRQRSLHFPPALKTWLWLVVAGTAFALLQGGALTDTLTSKFGQLFMGVESTSYQTIGFALIWPPQIVSAQLGQLSLFNPWQALTAMLELGPAILAFPLLVVWGWKAYRAGRWYEAALVVSGLISLGAVLVNFTGSTGVRNTNRLYAFAELSLLFFVPLVWRWARHRRGTLQLLAGASGGLILMGGLVFFSVELFAIQQPVLTYFIDPLDVKMMEQHWDQLAEDSLVFDPLPWRAPTLFARVSDSYLTWYEVKPAWQRLQKAPYLHDLTAAGYSYLYLDETQWDALPRAVQASLQDACMVLVDEVQAKREPRYRKLYDLRGCP